MSSIELAEHLYRTLLTEGKPTDARVITFRTWFVNQFSEGHKIAVRIESERSASIKGAAVGAKSSGKKLHKFQHPSIGLPLQRRRQTVALPGERRSKFKETAPVKLNDTDELGLAETQTADKSPLSLLTQKPVKQTAQKDPAESVAVRADEPETVMPLSTSELKEIGQMTRNEIAEHIATERIVLYFKDNGVEYNEKANAKQLAGTLLQHLKSK